MMADLPRPAFNSYALPLPRRREGPAAALSFIAHVTIAVLVLWRGATLFESGGGGGTGPRGGGGGGGRPAVSWFTLPSVSTPQVHDVPPAPAVSVPTLAVPVTEPIILDVPALATVVINPPASIGTGEGTTGGPGQGPGRGGGKGTGTGTGIGSETGPGTGGDPNYIRPADVIGLIIPPECARGDILARFWVSADGVVTRVEVHPAPKNAGCREELINKLKSYKFRPARTAAGVPVPSVYPIQLRH